MTEIRVKAHPRAAASIRRVKGMAGLAAFVGTLLLSLRAGLLVPDAVARALVVGVATYFAAWAVAVAIWRQLVLAELESAHLRRSADSPDA